MPTFASKMPQYWRRQATGTLMLVRNFIFSRSSCGTLSYSGMTTRQPIRRVRSACGSEPATSARPPVAAKGSASLAQNNTFIKFTNPSLLVENLPVDPRRGGAAQARPARAPKLKPCFPSR